MSRFVVCVSIGSVAQLASGASPVRLVQRPLPVAVPAIERSASPSRPSSERVMDSTRITLSAPASAAPGDSIQITAAVENLSGRTMTLYLRGREPTFDIEVSDSRGSVVWRRLEGEVVPAVLRVETLAPGARIADTITWNLRAQSGEALAAGNYSITAHLLLETGRSSSTPIAFRVREPVQRNGAS